MNFTLNPSRTNDLIELLEGNIMVTAEKILCHYHLVGDFSRIAWPERNVGDNEREYELWNHTCFEFFLGRQDQPAYLEFNLSPSGNWNSFLFSDLRTGMAETDILRLTSMKVDSSLPSERQVSAFLDFDSGTRFKGPIRIGVSAVIEDIEGNRQYYALSHPKGRPDFHRRETHTLVCEI